MNASSAPVELSPEMKEAMSTLVDAVIFEQWIRFSWIEEDEEGDYCIQVPEESVREISADYPEYAPLLAQVNGTIVDADMACSAVLGFARQALGGNATAVLENAEFQTLVGTFHQWLHDNAERLDAELCNFDQWRIQFHKSLQGDQA